MPRKPRFYLPDVPAHVIQRGNNRSPLFMADEDYGCFRHYLQEACQRYDCHIHAWVFMTNHIHLLLTPGSENSISKIMQSVGRRYLQYFNSTYQRTGTLWEGRYKATIVDSEKYLFTCYRYIELNPVRANMLSHPGEYRWSSYHHSALGRSDSLVTPHERYLALSHQSEVRQTIYRDLFGTHIDNKTLEEIRQATQKGWALGSEFFKEEIEKLIQRRTRPMSRGGDHRSVEFKGKQT